MRRIGYAVLPLFLCLASSVPMHAQSAAPPDQPVIVAQGDSVLMLVPDLAYVQVAGAAELDALKRAVRDATDRANAIAEGAGKSAGAVVRMQEQRSSSASPVFRMDAGFGGAGGRGGSARPATPIEPGEIQVRATVMLTVAIR